jgi:hypothetical protein
MKTVMIIAALLALTITHDDSLAQANTKQIKNSNMNSKDFTTTILVDKDAATAFKAISNFRGWWSEEIEGKTDQLNETFFYHYKDVHLSRIKLIEIVPVKKLVYEVVENEFNFTQDKTEWVGTKLIFELVQEGDKTKIIFTHNGLVPEYECYDVCHDAWTGYIQGSLQSFINTGAGKPNGKEGGLNAELVEKWGLPDTPANKPSGESYTTSLLTNKSPQEVFDAINNVRGWWQGEITGNTGKLNEEFTYEMKPYHFT